MTEGATQHPRYRIVVPSLPDVWDIADDSHMAALTAVNVANDARAMARVIASNGKDLPVFPYSDPQEVERLIDGLG